MKYVEVELKYALPDPRALKTKLEALGAVAGPESHQIDVYYNPPHKNFLKDGPHRISEWLRIRTDKERGGSFNYKLWHPVDTFPKTHATEYESTVGDVEALRLALEALGFTPIVTVDKHREAWIVDDVEVAFDTVENLGRFVEFEYKGDAADEVAATTHLKEFIASLEIELGEQSYGYPHMLL